MAPRWLACLVVCGCGRIGFDGRMSPDVGSLTLTYPRPEITAVLDATVVSLVPVVSDPAAHFAIEPPLPAGLALDPLTGAIAGTPSQSAEDRYTVTAATGAATATALIAITVLPGYVVDSTLDAPDADGGIDAACVSTAASGGCTLRAAIQTANQRTGRQLVLLDAQRYALGSALDAITNDIQVTGQGAAVTVIRAATIHPAYAALSLATPHTLALHDLAIQDFGGDDGGALAVTAGILDVDRCAFTNNASPTSGGVLFINGGASATLARSTFTQNSSNGGNGGGWGGVIDGEGVGTTIVVSGSTAIQNTTAWGSFSHITTGTTLRLESSTLYANTSTIAGTLATPGGIYTLVNDTIVANANTNTTPDSAGIYLYSAPCAYTVTNTIVALNIDATGTEHDCNRRDTTTVITSGGGNILGDAGHNCAAMFTATGDLLSTDPGVEPAAPTDHGGPTGTIMLVPGAKAIDGGQDAMCPALDQRGLERPVGAACDVGAVEMQ